MAMPQTTQPIAAPDKPMTPEEIEAQRQRLQLDVEDYRTKLSTSIERYRAQQSAYDEILNSVIRPMIRQAGETMKNQTMPQRPTAGSIDLNDPEVASHPFLRYSATDKAMREAWGRDSKDPGDRAYWKAKDSFDSMMRAKDKQALQWYDYELSVAKNEQDFQNQRTAVAQNLANLVRSTASGADTKEIMAALDNAFKARTTQGKVSAELSQRLQSTEMPDLINTMRQGAFVDQASLEARLAGLREADPAVYTQIVQMNERNRKSYEAPLPSAEQMVAQQQAPASAAQLSQKQVNQISESVVKSVSAGADYNSALNKALESAGIPEDQRAAAGNLVTDIAGAGVTQSLRTRAEAAEAALSTGYRRTMDILNSELSASSVDSLASSVFSMGGALNINPRQIAGLAFGKADDINSLRNDVAAYVRTRMFGSPEESRRFNNAMRDENSREFKIVDAAAQRLNIFAKQKTTEIAGKQMEAFRANGIPRQYGAAIMDDNMNVVGVFATADTYAQDISAMSVTAAQAGNSDAFISMMGKDGSRFNAAVDASLNNGNNIMLETMLNADFTRKLDPDMASRFNTNAAKSLNNDLPVFNKALQDGLTHRDPVAGLETMLKQTLVSSANLNPTSPSTSRRATDLSQAILTGTREAWASESKSIIGNNREIKSTFYDMVLNKTSGVDGGAFEVARLALNGFGPDGTSRVSVPPSLIDALRTQNPEAAALAVGAINSIVAEGYAETIRDSSMIMRDATDAGVQQVAHDIIGGSYDGMDIRTPEGRAQFAARLNLAINNDLTTRLEVRQSLRSALVDQLLPIATKRRQALNNLEIMGMQDVGMRQGAEVGTVISDTPFNMNENYIDDIMSMLPGLDLYPEGGMINSPIETWQDWYALDNRPRQTAQSGNR